jgi:dTDP-4-amino-4,6-dideoxygalactose transaminase
LMEKFPKQIGVGGLVISDYEKQLVNEVLESNRLTYGPMTKRFEEEFAGSHGCRFGLFMNSGTSALHVALAALKQRYGWADGDEVIVPAVTFVATSNIVSA